MLQVSDRNLTQKMIAVGGYHLNRVLTYNLAGVAVGLYLNRILTYNFAGVAVLLTKT